MAKEVVRIVSVTSLIRIIREEILAGQERAKAALENEKTVTYWKIGRHIHDFLLQKKDRASYGDALFEKLAVALGISSRTLYNVVQFYEMYPRILNVRSKLTWSHFRLLLRIEDADTRKLIEQRIIRENLSTRELEILLKQQKLIPGPQDKNKTSQLIPKRGQPFVYNLKQLAGSDALYIDCGFRVYRKLPDKEAGKYAVDSILQVSKNANRYYYSLHKDAGNINLFTYVAVVKEIIDGDTLWVNIDLGCSTFICQKLRLRGINAEGPETEPGRKARNFIVSQLGGCDFIITKTYWRDKFDRYLTDVYYNRREEDILDVAGNGAFLNQELLDKGLVVRY